MNMNLLIKSPNANFYKKTLVVWLVLIVLILTSCQSHQINVDRDVSYKNCSRYMEAIKDYLQNSKYLEQLLFDGEEIIKYHEDENGFDYSISCDIGEDSSLRIYTYYSDGREYFDVNYSAYVNEYGEGLSQLDISFVIGIQEILADYQYTKDDVDDLISTALKNKTRSFGSDKYDSIHIYDKKIGRFVDTDSFITYEIKDNPFPNTYSQKYEESISICGLTKTGAK